MTSCILFFLLDCNGNEITLVRSPDQRPYRDRVSCRTSGRNLEIHLPHADQSGSQTGILDVGQRGPARGAPQGDTDRRLLVETRVGVGGGLGHGFVRRVWPGLAIGYRRYHGSLAGAE